MIKKTKLEGKIRELESKTKLFEERKEENMGETVKTFAEILREVEKDREEKQERETSKKQKKK